MKITSKSILKILRMYKLADDNTSIRSIRNVSVVDEGEYMKASWVYSGQKFGLVLGSMLEDDDISNIWTEWSETSVVLPNPLDPTQILTPFKGKYLAVFNIPAIKTRLDTYLSSKFDATISRSLWQKYIKLGCVKVNGEIIKSSSKEISDTDQVSVNFPEDDSEIAEIPIIYQDNDVIVVDKPAGLLTHAKGGIASEKTLADFFKLHISFTTNSDRPGIVHRLDRDTSGVIIGAKTEESAKFLQSQFADRKVEKEYLAIVVGKPKHHQAKIDLPISRNPNKPSTFKVDGNGKPSQTIYEVLSSNDDFSLVRLKPITGRTHQLRVHMSYINCPIVGDRVYSKAGDRLFLHAHKITLHLPCGRSETFTATIPDAFKNIFPEAGA